MLERVGFVIEAGKGCDHDCAVCSFLAKQMITAEVGRWKPTQYSRF